MKRFLAKAVKFRIHFSAFLISCLCLSLLAACAQTGPTTFTMNEKTIDEFFDGKGEADNPLVVPTPEKTADNQPRGVPLKKKEQ